MRDESQTLRRAPRLVTVTLIAVCLSLAGCRQWARHDHDGHDHLAHDHAHEMPQPKKKLFNLDSLRDERAIAVDRHMNGSATRMASRRTGMRNAPNSASASPLDDDPAKSFLPATESESTDP